MKRLSSIVAGAVLFCAAAAAAETCAERARSMSPGMPEFCQRVEAYAELRRGLERQLPAQPRRDDDVDAIHERRRNLAELLRQRRSGAQRGDIFTKESSAALRAIIENAAKASSVKLGIVGTQEKPKVALAVNAEYPEGEPLPSVPSPLLNSLPPLPEDLEYRFVDRTLLLLDRKANMIVDYLEKAAPRR